MAKSAAAKSTRPDEGYTAATIEVLEGLEPVRRRPGMYIGGTDERAAHHLFAEVLDNAMDEAVAGHAKRIAVRLEADGTVSVADDGRGIPVDPHPKFPDRSALEVILTTLHAGGKFSGQNYATSGGLNGVGVSVVNALSERLDVTVVRDGAIHRQVYARGHAQGALAKESAPRGTKRGTTVAFLPDEEIFGARARLKPARLHAMAKAKAYLRPGVAITWSCAPELVEGSDVPAEAEFHFPGGLADYLREILGERSRVAGDVFAGETDADDHGRRCAFAVAWTAAGFGEADGFVRSYANTIPTPQGGTHEQGLRSALTRSVRAYAELKGDKKASLITPEDVMGTAAAMVSVFVPEPEFQGQTKERLATADAARLVETAVRDPFDHWLAAAPKEADKLLAWVIERAEERVRRRKEREVARKSATKKLRLPGKLADCASSGKAGSEIFLVEGDSAGGSAKQARDRKTQAVLPLRGKILNVASASGDKIMANQEINDLLLALGVGPGAKFALDDLRYERVIIMTDADVDGAHIAALLITFFLKATPGLIEHGRLYMALPPLFRLSRKGVTHYARDEADRERLMAEEFTGSGKVEVSRFKGLGEMMPRQLKETTMDTATRTLARVAWPAERADDVEALVTALMGRKADARFQFIQDNARFLDAADMDV